MNSFDVKCYAETYKDPQYWQDSHCENELERRNSWKQCRQLSNRFYDELIARGYLILKKE